MVKLFAIKQKYSDRIYAKEKFVEFRRQNIKVRRNEKCLIYTSSPVKKITGYFTVKEKIRYSLDKLWEKTRKFAGITKNEFMKYFEGCKEGTAIIFLKVKKFVKGLSLSDIRCKVRTFKPPQSYYNLDARIAVIISRDLGKKVPSLFDF